MWLQPSIAAASYSSSGMVVWKKVRVTMMCHTMAAPMITMIARVSSSPSERTSRYLGMRPPSK